ncbi:MAG: tRNA epoxyqueuosine(34) reductase QueG [Acidobacteria bacterium]|nr:tRNA epoxyqueuosine(34) reductase QueG [Acidobacteriota bacterium]
MTSTQIARRLRAWALELGFDRAGVACLKGAVGADSLRRWLERGDHAEMAYMAERVALRADPREVFDGATSAVCVALQYEPQVGAVTGDLWPGVARYARGRDYHNVMGKRLRKLARRIRVGFPGTETRHYVDTGPVLERDLAARAGLGVAGKNTMLLHPEAGSYFMLGEILTSLELEPDEPLADLCGSCSLCLEACPTGALSEPYRLDSRRCISYWTIEHRGAIPAEMRSALGQWVFGCDVCQEACPHNDRLEVSPDPAFSLPASRQSLDLAALSALDEAAYQEVLRGSPMKRSRREGLRRNAALAMGNRGDLQYVPPLGRMLDDGDPVLRSHAAWALGRIGGAEAEALLLGRLGVEGEEEVSGELISALAWAEEGASELRAGSS